MLSLIEEFPAQMLQALEIGENAKLGGQLTDIRNVVICGMGGSGIGGDLLAELLSDNLSVPVIVNKSYSLPAFVNQQTLMIACSYSGNTEETISVTAQAMAKGALPVCVTSGGQLLNLANQNKLNAIVIPGGLPPRACLGYSVTQLFYVLHHYGLIDDSFKTSLRQTAAFLKREQDSISAASKTLAAWLPGKIIIAFCEDRYASTALRLKQQINENSKMCCWYNAIPELNHNEIVGWREVHKQLAVLFLRTDDEYSRNTQRLNFTQNEVLPYAYNTYEIKAMGSNSLERHFYFIHFGDWLSYHLSTLKDVDVVEVKVIDRLKAQLSNIQ